MKRFFAFFIIGGFSAMSNASFVDEDVFMQGDGALSVDQNTGLGWLDLIHTNSMDRSQAQLFLAATPELSNYRFATTYEVVGMTANYFSVFNNGQQRWTDLNGGRINEFIDEFTNREVIITDSPYRETGYGRTHAFGFTELGSNALVMTGVRATNYENGSTTGHVFFAYERFDYVDTYDNFNYSHWLVTDTLATESNIGSASDVNVNTAWLVMSCTILLLTNKRKKLGDLITK